MRLFGDFPRPRRELRVTPRFRPSHKRAIVRADPGPPGENEFKGEKQMKGLLTMAAAVALTASFASVAT
ncbi:MAG: hypothetical protein ABI450_13115, partial [Rhizomicrobium sp.]